MSIRFREDRKRWQVRVTVNGKMIEMFCESKAEAKRLEIDLRLKNHGISGIDPNYSIEDAFASFLETESAQKANATRNADQRTLDIARQFFDSKRLFHVEQVTLEDLQRFQLWAQTEYKWSDTTTAARCKVLRSVFNKLTITERIRKNPAQHWKIPLGTSMRRRAMTEVEFLKLIQSDPSSWLVPVLHFIRLTGSRGASVADLKWSDIDLSTATLLLSSRKLGLKKLVRKPFPIYPELLSLLSSVPRRSEFVFLDQHGQQLTGHKISLAASRLIKRAGLKGVVLYGLRHAIATELIESGASTEIARKALGHSSLNQIQTYTQSVGMQPLANALTIIRGGKKDSE